MVGVSLTIAISCLGVKIFTFEVLCSFAAWIFSVTKNRLAEILCIFQGGILQS